MIEVRLTSDAHLDCRRAYAAMMASGQCGEDDHVMMTCGGRQFVGHRYDVVERKEQPRLLSAETIEQLAQACGARGLSRDLLLTWVPDAIRTRIASGRSPYESYKNDIIAVSTSEPALTAWLEQAIRLAKPFPEAAVFRKALAGLGKAPEPGVPIKVSAVADGEALVRFLSARLRQGWREAALARLPVGFRYSLPVVSRPHDQLRFDLMEIRRTPRLIGCAEAPMSLYLSGWYDFLTATDRDLFAQVVRSSCVMAG